MTDPDPLNPGTDPVEPTTPASSTPPGTSQAVDWEARYKGLQRTFDRLTKDFETLKGKYDQLVGETETVRQDHRKTSDDYTTLKTAFQALETTNKQLEGDLTANRVQVERTKTIMAEFPDLAPFEAQGLLPSAATLDELKTKLESFRKAIGETTGKAALKQLQGFTPPSSANINPPAGPSKESIFAELTRLSGRRSPAEQARYDELIALWDEANKPQ